jgi:3-methyl-2-oxobutanoate hydroxymethyltransferase
VSQASGSDAPGKRVTTRAFAAAKGRAERLVMVAAYDALFARLSDEAGVDAVLVGDSLGNVVAGFDSTVPVTLEQMIYHGSAVRRGARARWWWWTCRSSPTRSPPSARCSTPAA